MRAAACHGPPASTATQAMLGPPVSATIAIATTATAVDTETTATTATTIACYYNNC